MINIGVPGYVRRSHMICKPPKKGTRKTMEFRTDSVRPSNITQEEWEKRLGDINFGDVPLEQREGRIVKKVGGRIRIKIEKQEEKKDTSKLGSWPPNKY